MKAKIKGFANMKCQTLTNPWKEGWLQLTKTRWNHRHSRTRPKICVQSKHGERWKLWGNGSYWTKDFMPECDYFHNIAEETKGSDSCWVICYEFDSHLNERIQIWLWGKAGEQTLYLSAKTFKRTGMWHNVKQCPDDFILGYVFY